MKPRMLSAFFLVLALSMVLLPRGSWAANQARDPNSAEASAPPRVLSEPPWSIDERVNDDGGTTWQLERVDAPKLIAEMTDRCLRLDAQGRPHLAYGGDHLYYAWYDGTQWNAETVDDSWGVGRHASLALDGAGNPHIAYYDYINEDLKYAYWTGSEWDVQTVDTNGWSVGQYPSLAVDGAENPHISYYGDGDVRYAYLDGGEWHMDTVGAFGGVGSRTSLAVDEAGEVHIAFPDYTDDYTVRYAWKDAAGWHIETVGGGGSPSLAVDQVGQVYLSYYDSTNNRLRYGWRDGNGWHLENVYQDWVTLNTISLAIDGTAHPHIGYYSYMDDCLRYAHWTGTQWDVQVVASSVYMPAVSIDVDEAGFPQIGYYDWADGNLLRAEWTGDAWGIETVDSGGEVGHYSSLVLDAAGHPNMSYTSYTGLKYARWTGSEWAIESVDSLTHAGQHSSIALDSTGNPHISYYVNGICDLRYAWKDATGWHIETVDSAGYVGGYTSLAMDELGYPHISYTDATNWDLKHAWKDAAGWHIETVDSAGEVGTYTSLALDQVGRPHISYCDLTNSDLKYAWKDVAGWHIETVDSSGSVGSHTSLELDSMGYPHISYSGDSDLKYAHWTARAWAIETVDTDVATCTSLALDSGDHPRISYYNPRDLKSAHWDGNAWNIETVDAAVGSAFSGTSVALDAAGSPHISYYDEANGDLKYARGGPGPDIDADGLPDMWEQDGIDVNGDGTVDLDLPAMGADPLHKDIFVEVDYMEHHRPGGGAIQDVINAFAAARVSNPDDLDGINLHVLVDDQIPHQDAISVWADFDNIKDTYLGTLIERSSPNWENIRSARRLVFRYCLFVHQYNLHPSSSGLAELGGDDFLVSLGAPGWGTDAGGHSVGTRDEQRATFMHELGHTLGLRHGGGDDTNCKPNYLSIMSYSRQFSWFVPGRPLDYSRACLRTLVENDLDEWLGVQGDSSMVTVYGPCPDRDGDGHGDCRIASAFGAIDWDADGFMEGESVAGGNVHVNINKLGFPDCDDADDTQALTGYDDWANLLYSFRSTANYPEGAHVAVADPEITVEIVEEMRQIADYENVYLPMVARNR